MACRFIIRYRVNSMSRVWAWILNFVWILTVRILKGKVDLGVRRSSY